jgi:GT2 family glycosyltransferase
LAGSAVPAQIVVADQSTTPPAIEPRRDGGSLVHLRLERPGVSRGRNAGIEEAVHDLLAFVDDDVVVDADWLIRLVGALESAPDRTIVTGAVLAPDGPGVTPSLTTRTEPVVLSGRPGVDALFGGNMAFRRSVVEEIGPFDERLGPGASFPSAEDNDFGFRALEAGYRIQFVPDAVVWHVGVRLAHELRRLDWAYGRGQGAYYAKHFHVTDPFMVKQFGRNVGERVRHPRREAVYLAGLVLGAADWVTRYRVFATRRRA